MSRVAVLSDIHAGLGKDDPDMRELQGTAVKRAVSFLSDQDIDTLILNGDITDHLLNALAVTTDRKIAREVLSPLVTMTRENRDHMKTVVLPGNTDWPIRDMDPKKQKAFFKYSGFARSDIEIPGALWTYTETDDVAVIVTHGHALKPDFFPYKRPYSDEDGMKIWAKLNAPDESFLQEISATSGSHRRDYLKAAAIGTVTKMMPLACMRETIVDMLGGRFTQQYEKVFAELLEIGRRERLGQKVLGVMGHTHVAGIREYGDITIMNTGTAGAKPNPLQRVHDSKAHLAIVDTDHGTYELIRTFNAARPTAKPEIEAHGDFAHLSDPPWRFHSTQSSKLFK